MIHDSYVGKSPFGIAEVHTTLCTYTVSDDEVSMNYTCSNYQKRNEGIQWFKKDVPEVQPEYSI